MKTTVLLFLMFAAAHLHAEPVAITVSAASSLKVPLEVLRVEFEKMNPDVAITYNFGSSGSLQQQIVNGAPVDVFISAAARQMDELDSCGLIVTESRFILARNTLVLITPAGSPELAGFEELSSADIKKIAAGEPRSVPAGTYAMDLLGHLGLIDAVKDKLVYAKDVRQVVVYVETGNADAGIVYGSDAAGSQAVRVVAEAPEGSHRKIAYSAAIVRASTQTALAAVFLDFLKSPAATVCFQSAGFVTAPAQICLGVASENRSDP